MRLSLTKEEKQLLYKKYKKNGLDHEFARDKVNDFVDRLNELVRKLRENKKSYEDINTKFKQEFEKVCMRLDQ